QALCRPQRSSQERSIPLGHVDADVLHQSRRQEPQHTAEGCSGMREGRAASAVQASGVAKGPGRGSDDWSRAQQQVACRVTTRDRDMIRCLSREQRLHALEAERLRANTIDRDESIAYLEAGFRSSRSVEYVTHRQGCEAYPTGLEQEAAHVGGERCGELRVRHENHLRMRIVDDDAKAAKDGTANGSID